MIAWQLDVPKMLNKRWSRLVTSSHVICHDRVLICVTHYGIRSYAIGRYRYRPGLSSWSVRDMRTVRLDRAGDVSLAAIS